jgi:hypothetical protein
MPKAHRFFPDDPEYKAALTAAYRTKYGKEPPAGYFGSRNDGLGLTSSSGSIVDPQFGVGYEVVDPAPTRGLGRSRAQKIGYNEEQEYLVILMRDNKVIGYPGVTKSEWDSLDGYNSTTDYIEYVLARYSGGQWDDVRGTPPQSTGQSFEQGTVD